jgi:hypothetical protein
MQQWAIDALASTLFCYYACGTARDADMPTLVAALLARDRQLSLSVAQEERQIA